jgi:hypothetical protein
MFFSIPPAIHGIFTDNPRYSGSCDNQPVLKHLTAMFFSAAGILIVENYGPQHPKMLSPAKHHLSINSNIDNQH